MQSLKATARIFDVAAFRWMHITMNIDSEVHIFIVKCIKILQVDNNVTNIHT